jgi:hypothetical protein
MPFGEFQDFADCVSKNQDKDDPKAFCGFIQKSIEGATANVLKIANAKYKTKTATASGCSTMCLATASFFQKDGANFAKFFLINGQENLKGWRVTEASLPKFLKTFIGKPFISEPELAHFGADDMPVHEVMQAQEEFRVGDIVDVTFDPKTTQAEAIVKFHNTPEGEKIWNEIQAGKAIYVSPAVAGFSFDNPKNGQPVFVEWYGLHLARVDNPAYGVFHASLKKTCTGDEKHCLDMLIASANIHTTVQSSSIISKEVSSVKMAEENIGSTKDSEKQKGVDNPKTGTDTEEIKELRDENASLKSKVANFEKESETETSTDEVKELKKQVADLTEKQEQAEDEEKKEVAEDIIEEKKETAEEEMTDDEVKEETASLMKKSLASLKEIQGIYKSANASVKAQVADLQSRVGSKIVNVPSVASASKDSKKVTMETIRELI